MQAEQGAALDVRPRPIVNPMDIGDVVLGEVAPKLHGVFGNT